MTPARCELSKAMQNYLELHRHAAVRVELLQHPGVALRLMVAHAIGGLRAVAGRARAAAGSRNEAIAESIGQSRAQSAFAEVRQQIEALLGSSSNDDVIDLPGDVTTATATLFARLLSLSDDEVLQVLAFVMADSLEVGTAVLEAVGNHLSDRHGPVLAAGRRVLRSAAWQGRGQRHARRGRGPRRWRIKTSARRWRRRRGSSRTAWPAPMAAQQVEGWLPGYLAFPFQGLYRPGWWSDRGGLAKRRRSHSEPVIVSVGRRRAAPPSLHR